MRDFNHDELVEFAALTKDNDVTVRFIELMPFDSHQIWKTGKFYRAEHIVADLNQQISRLEQVDGSKTEHYIFRIKGYKGKNSSDTRIFQESLWRMQPDQDYSRWEISKLSLWSGGNQFTGCHAQRSLQ
ncbi:MAG: hypothetical protein Ct9H300mP29_2380 [Candidatus Neomarinimicrobiota bacterium]|nr:MAG: hypothetical protein Ct9H300mP29_2380 [Candidatus Neomarinimicrobiota bacterium]